MMRLTLLWLSLQDTSAGEGGDEASLLQLARKKVKDDAEAYQCKDTMPWCDSLLSRSDGSALCAAQDRNEKDQCCVTCSKMVCWDKLSWCPGLLDRPDGIELCQDQSRQE